MNRGDRVAYAICVANVERQETLRNGLPHWPNPVGRLLDKLSHSLHMQKPSPFAPMSGTIG